MAIEINSLLYSINNALRLSPLRLVSPRGVMANMLDYRLDVNEFEPKSRYYIYFPSNRLGKGILYPDIGVGRGGVMA